MKRINTLKKYVLRIGKGMKNRINTAMKTLQENSGMSIIEILLILVVNLTPQNRVWIA